MIGLYALAASDVNAQATYTVTVTVQGFPSSLFTNLYVDGTPNSTLRGGESKTFTFTVAPTTHVITVDFYVPSREGANGTRYYQSETSWSFNTGGAHVFTYTTQYYLNVETPYAAATGEGWYDAGSTAQVSLRVDEIEESPGIRQVFTGWSGGGSGSSLNINVLMDSPKTLIAHWKTQFYLTLTANPPSVTNLQGAGWYDAGSYAEFSAPSIIPATENSRLRFTHWTGSYAGEMPSGSVLMDRPKAVEAHYIAQYLLAVQYSPASIATFYNETRTGWYDANSNVQLGPAPTLIELSSIERLRFNGWNQYGTISGEVSITVLMDGPKEIILLYTTQYYVEVRSTYSSVSGSGWYDKDSMATISAATSTGTWPVKYTFSGWRVEPSSGKLVKDGQSWKLLVDRPYVVEAVWNIDYLPILGLLGAGAFAVAVLSVALTLAYKRGLLTHGLTLPSRPRRPRLRRVCSTCGNQLPEGAVFCQRCGASAVPAAPPITSQDEKVYDYIVKHDGVISLSKAAKDLGMSVEDLKATTERLKKKGRLA